jgi:hypothetical protein
VGGVKLILLLRTHNNSSGGRCIECAICGPNTERCYSVSRCKES